MPQFHHISVETKDDILIIYFNYRKILDEVIIQPIAQELQEVIPQATGKKILLDWCDVDYISSTMVGKLFLFDKKCKAAEITLKMCSITGAIMEDLISQRLHKIFDIELNERQALAAFAAEE